MHPSLQYFEKYYYVSSFNDIMVTNRNMVQYRKDKRYDRLLNSLL